MDSDLVFHFTDIFRVRNKQKRITIMKEYITNPADYAILFFHITHTLLTSLEEKHKKKIHLVECPSSSLAIVYQI